MLQNLINKQNKIDRLYSTTEELGAIYKDGITHFKLWSPTSKKVTLNIFDKNDKNNLIKSVNPIRSNKGVWNFIEKELDLDGYFYQYIVDGKEILDPYAKSIASFRISPKGIPLEKDAVAKGAIIDLSKTKKLKPFKLENFSSREDAIIYELHVRDFTSSKVLKNSKPGSYKAFIENIDFLKKTNVTHVQLLPVMKFYYNDEENKEMENHWSSKYNNYNWGYDPYSYFSPEGVYASNTDPYTRIEELKELIETLHEKGIGVILDVVYTHTYSTSLFNNIVDKYYYFFKENGEYAGGFGNNLATTQKMVRKLILDSVKYWFEEFKIDGMRFDMMGDADSTLMEEVAALAKSINPQAVLIGEGWRTFQGQAYNALGADQDWANKSSAIGMFNDDIRNLAKSGFQKEGKPRFLTNGKVSIRKLFKNIKAQPTNFKPLEPSSVIQYIEAHDNATLHDIIALAMKYDTSKDQDKIQKRIRLGNFLILTSQGVPFIHAGQEYGRSKEWKDKNLPEQKYLIGKKGIFIDDSYDSTDLINTFDWKKTTDLEVEKTMNFTYNLIKLRKNIEIFRYKTYKEINKNIKLIKTKEKDIFIAYKNKDYFIFINADETERDLPLKFKNFKVLVDGDKVNENGIENPEFIRFEKDKVKIAPLSAILLKGEEI